MRCERSGADLRMSFFLISTDATGSARVAIFVLPSDTKTNGRENSTQRLWSHRIFDLERVSSRLGERQGNPQIAMTGRCTHRAGLRAVSEFRSDCRQSFPVPNLRPRKKSNPAGI